MNVRFCNVSQKIQIILISQHADVFQKHTTRIAFEYIYSANIFNTYVALCIVYCYDQYAIFRTIYNITKVVDMNTPVKESDNDLSVSGHIAFCEKNIYEVEKKTSICQDKKIWQINLKSIRERFPEDFVSVLNAHFQCTFNFSIKSVRSITLANHKKIPILNRTMNRLHSNFSWKKWRTGGLSSRQILETVN